MLGHDFTDMPGKSFEIGANPHETVMMLRCRWCMRTPAKAREDGCPVHELEEVGTISLAEYNPEGVDYFKGRFCLACDLSIMTHELRHGSNLYWCFSNQNQFSDGITGCVWDVEGVKVPDEPQQKDLLQNN